MGTPLKNLKHEKFAREMLTSKTPTEAIQKVYPDNILRPHVNGSKLIHNENIRARILELMQENAATSPLGVTKRLDELVSSENEGISMQAVNTTLKVYGLFDEQKTDSNIASIHISFGDASDTPKAVIEVQK